MPIFSLHPCRTSFICENELWVKKCSNGYQQLAIFMFMSVLAFAAQNALFAYIVSVPSEAFFLFLLRHLVTLMAVCNSSIESLHVEWKLKL